MKSGFLFINKPKNVTSYFCIAYIKKILKQKIKIGHAGTLDPFATGLLIVAIGRDATRHISHFMTLDKIYIATGKLGELTDTLDCTGHIIKNNEVVISSEDINKSIISMGENYEQTPPLYSALKFNGTPLYKLVRNKTKDISELDLIAQSKKRMVHLSELNLLEFNYPYFKIKAHVSHGTYVRSLVNDIATKIGSCATTYELERTKIGQFSLLDAVELESIVSLESIENNLLPIEIIDFIIKK